MRLQPVTYRSRRLGSWGATIHDYAALAGVLLAIVLVVKIGFEHRTGPIDIGIYLFALVAAFLSFPDSWRDVYGFSRPITPLLILFGMSGLARGSLIWVVPMALIIPRVVLPIGPQLIGSAPGLFGLRPGTTH